MSWVLAGAGCVGVPGWVAAAALLVALRRRIARVADAEHELRGAASVIELALDRASRTGFTVAIASLVRLQLDRMGAAVADLPGPRSHGAPAGQLDAGRLAQVLANLIANAVEHGDGPVEIRTSRAGGAVRLQLRNRGRPTRADAEPSGRVAEGRGRGLAIARRAAEQLGASVEVTVGDDETVASIELPAGDLRRAA